MCIYFLQVLHFDATLASHPIVVDVSTPDQINAVFDIISYNKGASVIRSVPLSSCDLFTI